MDQCLIILEILGFFNYIKNSITPDFKNPCDNQALKRLFRDNGIETDSKIFPITYAGARLVGVIAPRAKSRFVPFSYFAFEQAFRLDQACVSFFQGLQKTPWNQLQTVCECPRLPSQKSRGLLRNRSVSSLLWRLTVFLIQ